MRPDIDRWARPHRSARRTGRPWGTDGLDLLDYGLTGRNQERPGLREAAVRAGEELVVTKLDRLARPVPDAREIADELTAKGIKLNLGGAVYDPNDPVGATAVHGAVDDRPVRGRPDQRPHQGGHEGRGRSPKLSPAQESHLVKLYRAAEHTGNELCELFGIGRATLYQAVHRAGGPGVGPDLPTFSDLL